MSDFLHITETNEAGIVTSTYVYTTPTGNGQDVRIDNIPTEVPDKTWKSLLDVFMPAGWPHSVTEDYLEYQIYDSLQAFSSSIAGLLASRAVLEGVGVGDASASATGALFLSILQESMGRIATILFAHRLGTSLEPECKMYRLLADIFNDAAMVLDCLSPVFPKPMRIIVFALASILRSLCGVAAGSSKASLSAHFARWGNLGELNAKDSSQETVISLLGMLVGCLVIKMTKSTFATWSMLMLLLSIHLATNHAAVRSVCMRTLNRQRANIVLSHLAKHGEVLTPKQVSAKERIFEHDGILRSADDKPLGYCKIGVPLSELLQCLGITNRLTGSTQISQTQLMQYFDLFQVENYLLHLEPTSRTVYIVLKNGGDASVQLKAWYHALLLALHMDQRSEINGDNVVLSATQSTLSAVTRNWESTKSMLMSAGWDLRTTALETTSGTRVDVKI